MKVFITGILGFKGSYLANLCVQEGHEVVGVDCRELWEIQDNEAYKLLKCHENDLITTYDGIYVESLLDAFANEEHQKPMLQADYVVHLAAQPIVAIGYKDPIGTLRNNTMLTAELIEFLLKDSENKDQIIVNVTTDKVYQADESGTPMAEDDLLDGYDPYSLSKAFADRWVSMLREITPTSKVVHNVRAGNVIGAGDLGDNRIITDLFHCYQKNIEMPCRSPHGMRPYQDVRDCVRGYLTLAINDELNRQENYKGESWNFGPDHSYYNIELLTGITQFFPEENEAKEIKIEGDIGRETKCLMLDSQKAKEKLDWEPSVDFFETCKDIAEWIMVG